MRYVVVRRVAVGWRRVWLRLVSRVWLRLVSRVWLRLRCARSTSVICVDVCGCVLGRAVAWAFKVGEGVVHLHAYVQACVILNRFRCRLIFVRIPSEWFGVVSAREQIKKLGNPDLSTVTL